MRSHRAWVWYGDDVKQAGGTGKSWDNDGGKENIPREAAREAGLCSTCRYARIIVSSRDSHFWQCTRSADDPSFPRYPALPVVSCRGFEE
jgi:hypothetical protein